MNDYCRFYLVRNTSLVEDSAAADLFETCYWNIFAPFGTWLSVWCLFRGLFSTGLFEGSHKI